MPSASPSGCCRPTTSCSWWSASPRTFKGRNALLQAGTPATKEYQRMDYQQNIDGCLAETIGARALDPAKIDAMRARAAPALEKLRRIRDDGTLPLLRLPGRKDDIAQLKGILKTFRAAPRQRFRDVIILGTGGSSLGGQTLYALANQRAQPQLHFMDNIDPATFEALFASLDPARAPLQKPGAPPESMTQFPICVSWLRTVPAPDGVGRHTIAITEPKDNPL